MCCPLLSLVVRKLLLKAVILVFAEVVVDTINRISALHRKLKLPQLWSEVAIIKALVYKYGNQHKKEKYFQGLKKVSTCRG